MKLDKARKKAKNNYELTILSLILTDKDLKQTENCKIQVSMEEFGRTWWPQF